MYKKLIICFVPLFFNVNTQPQQLNDKYVVKPEMIFVEGGTFDMGDPVGSYGQDLHKVRLSSYYIDRYEVTVAEFAKFINTTGYKTDAEKIGYSEVFMKKKGNEKVYLKKETNWRHDSSGKLRDKSQWNYPVVHVSWNDAVAYANWRGKRLPTEAEWEYVAKGGMKRKDYTYSGSDNIDDVGWYKKNSELKIHEVGTKKANILGIYDLSGNVSEWCSDLYGEYYYVNSPIDDPKGPEKSDHASFRIIRGDNYRSNAYPVWVRHCGDPNLPKGHVGFRCAR